MSLTLEDLKKLELPVKLACCDGRFYAEMKEITVTAFNSSGMLFLDEDGEEDYCHIGYLRSYKLAPRTKIVERDFWVNVYFGYISHGHISKEDADRNIGIDRISCKHIKLKFEVDADTGKFIREIE